MATLIPRKTITLEGKMVQSSESTWYRLKKFQVEHKIWGMGKAIKFLLDYYEQHEVETLKT